MYFSKRF